MIHHTALYNSLKWYFGVNHIDFRMREIVEYIDQLQSASETFLSTSKSYFESKQKLYQPLFSWEKSLQCALLEDGIFFTQVQSITNHDLISFQTERKPLNLASYLMKSNQIDGEVLQVCFTRYHQNILTLQVTLKRWKDRKTKLLSAAKHLSIKRQELLDKEMVKEDNQQQDDLSTPGPKTCTSFFDKLIFKRGGGTSKALPSPNYVEGIREVMPDTVVPPPSSPITINNLEEKTHLLSAGNIDISENTPGTNLDDNPLNSTSPSEIDHWTLIVHELQAEYKQLSDQTLDEFHRFMENKRRSLLDALIEYSSRQVCPSL